MSAVLGIEWSTGGLRVLELKGAGAQAALVGCLELPLPYDPAQAEAAGAQLKERLKAAGLRANRAIGVLRREQLLVRDVRYPAVGDEERPSLIQFQALKEITLPPDDAVIDFMPVSLPWPTGEQRALALVARKPHLTVLAQLAHAAGLKLEAVVPSSLALYANGLPLVQPPTTTAAFLADSELLVVHAGEIIFTRGLDVEEPLAQEIRRALAGYQSQFPRQPVQELFIAGAELPADLESVVGTQRLPVRWYDPFTAVAGASGKGLPQHLLPVLGAAQAGLRWPVLGVNFVHPKKNQPKPSRKRFYAIAGGTALAAVLLLLGVFYFLTSSAQAADINRLKAEITELKKTTAAYGNLEERTAALAAWTSQEIVLLDELYDLAARFPDASGIRITRAEWTPLTTVAAPGRPTGRVAAPTAPAAGTKKNSKPIGRMYLEVQADSAAKLEGFRRELDRGHWSVDLWEKDQTNSNQVRVVVKVFPIEAAEYASRLELGTHKTQPGEIRPENTRPGRFGATRPPNRGGRP